MPFNNLHNEEELLSRMVKGDEAAFSSIYHELFRPLCYFAEKLTGNREQAEDIAAESFVKLLHAENRSWDFKSWSELKSFLYTLTRNSCLDFLRRRKLQGNIYSELLQKAENSNNEIEEAIITAEILQTIYTAIHNLPDRYRNVVQMALVDGLSNEEIEKATGMASQTIRNHKYEGIKLLRLSLSNDAARSTGLLIACLSWLASQS